MLSVTESAARRRSTVGFDFHFVAVRTERNQAALIRAEDLRVVFGKPRQNVRMGVMKLVQISI